MFLPSTSSLLDRSDYLGGTSECIELVQYGKPPSNKKERFKVLQTMFAHAQYALYHSSAQLPD